MKSLFWNKLSTLGTCYPTSREGHSWINSQSLRKWILFGGIGTSRSNEIFLYDSVTSLWESPAVQGKPPQERNYHVSWFDDSCKSLFIFGGQSDKRDPLYDFYALNFELNAWIRLYPSDQPTGRIYSSGCILGDRFYLFGGASAPEDSLNNDLWSFPFKEINWTEARSEGHCPSWNKHQTINTPNSRKGHSLVGFGGNLILFGGLTDKGHSNDLFVISVNDWRWNKANTMGHGPSPRAFHGAAIVAQKIMVIFGGLEAIKTGRSERINILNDVFILDLQDMHWSSPFIGGFSPSKRHSLGIAWGANRLGREQLLIVGGIEQSFAGMDIFSLEEAELDPGQAWHLEEPQSTKKKMFSMTESAILSNRKKIRDLEGQVYNTRYRVSNIEDEILKLKSTNDEMKKVDKMNEDKLQDTINRLEESKREKIDEGFMLRKETENKEKRYKLFVGRLEVLEDLIKKSESLLISVDSIFNEVIADNAGPNFVCLNKEKMGEIDDSRALHQESIKQLKNFIEKQGNRIEELSVKIEESEKELLKFEGDTNISLEDL
ncbi:unnamed protein product [Blepharisma stoltei]|uniref:Kelch repeat-containing protein n=1 Tax=Blepharisma stoltei TaxID=1481888 RepID=A0AAU9JU13_9CILI|nr:unnamed protein product [Blepharisma stoltei]